jgi:hypothetical protein
MFILIAIQIFWSLKKAYQHCVAPCYGSWFHSILKFISSCREMCPKHSQIMEQRNVKCVCDTVVSTEAKQFGFTPIQDSYQQTRVHFVHTWSYGSTATFRWKHPSLWKIYVVISAHFQQPVHNNQPTEFTMFSIRCVYHITALSMLTCFNPHGIITTEQTCLFVCLFSWRYNPLCFYFPQPGSGL